MNTVLNNSPPARDLSNRPAGRFRASIVIIVAVAMIVVSIVGLLATVYLSYAADIEGRLRDTERNIEAVGKYVTGQFDVLEAAVDDVLELLDKRAPENIAISELIRIKQHVESRLLHHEIEINIWLPDGRNAILPENGPRIDDRDSFQAHFLAAEQAGATDRMRNKKTGSIIGDPLLGRVSGRRILPINRALYDDRKKIVGVVSATAPESNFLDLFNILRHRETDVIFMTRDDTVGLIRQPFNERFTGVKLPQSLVFQNYPRQLRGRFEGPAATDGVRRIGVHMGLAPLPVVFGISFEPAKLSWIALEPYRNLIAINVVVLIFAISFASATYFATRRADAQAKVIAHTHEQLKVTLNATVEGIVTIEANGIIRSANGATERLFGYSREELVGQNVRILMPEPYHSEHDGYLSNYSRTGIGQIIGIGREVQARRKDGSIFDIDLAVAKLPPEADNGSFIGTIRDLSGRKKIENALLAQREMLDEIVNNSPSMIWVYDSEMRLTLVNDPMARWFGQTKGSLIGKTIFDLFDHDLAKILNDANMNVFQNGVRMVDKINVATETHGERIVQITRFPLKNEDGLIWGVVGVGIDVTDEIQAEDRLRQAQRMEAIGQLTGGVAHDFNNLLAVVMGNLQLLERRGLNDETRERLLTPALRAAKRGAELTRQLLAFGRRQTLRAVPTRLDELLPSLRDMLGRTLGETIAWDWKFGHDLAPCLVDPAQLEAAILNLAINARDAMSEGGKIGIDARNFTAYEGFGAEHPEIPAGQYVVISVSDEGTGMAPEVRARVFEPFFTTKDVGKGSGLGLSMVYGFVTQSGGHVTINSAPGLGTTVSLYLPRALPENKTPEDDEGEAGAVSAFRGTVLIVEDQEDVRATAIAQLEDLGFTVLYADSGAEARSVLLTHQGAIDLLFTDVVLGNNMNGPDLVEEARQINPNIKVIYVSGYAESMRGGGHGLDQDAYLLDKPYSQEELVEALKEVLGSSVGS